MSADVLRALLANDDRALEWLNEVTYNAVTNSGEPLWAEAGEWYRDYWGKVKAKQHAALLVALREVTE